MRRITLWAMSTVAALVLLFSYRTSTSGPGATQETAQVSTQSPGSTSSDPGSTGSDSGSGSTGSDSTGSGSGSESGGSADSGKATDGTFQGSVAQTRWGPLQVSITVAAGKITEVNVLAYPNGNHRDEEINAYALPILRQEALQKQSADIDAVSGATVTTDGYRESLQAALDAAGLS